MKLWIPRALFGCLLAAALWAAALAGQRGAATRQGSDQEPPAGAQGEIRLPNGKSQRDEILKAERQQNIKDAAQLVEMAQQLQQDLEKNDRYVLSISTLKKTDEIEKLVRKIRARLRHD